jgi:hypothetical protein
MNICLTYRTYSNSSITINTTFGDEFTVETFISKENERDI